MTLSLDDARRVIAAGQAATAEIACSIVVVDNARMLVAAERMDGARMLAADVAQKKAETAAAFGIDTKRFCEMVEADARRLAVFAADPAVKLLWGGVPLVREGLIVGAVGVSGGTDEQDHRIAQVAAGVVA